MNVIASCFRTQPTCNARYGKYLHSPGTARFQLIWRFWNWDSRHPECLLPEGSLRRRLNIGTRQTMRTATDRHSLLMGIMLNSNHPVHAGMPPEGGVSAGPSNGTGRLPTRSLAGRTATQSTRRSPLETHDLRLGRVLAPYAVRAFPRPMAVRPGDSAPALAALPRVRGALPREPHLRPKSAARSGRWTGD